MSLRGSLFAKIYLTLLASLFALALAGAAVVRSLDGEQSGFAARRDEILAALLPADAGATETQIVLSRLGAAFDADITVFTAEGVPIHSVGAPVVFTPPFKAHGLRREGNRTRLVVALPGDRVLAARLSLPFRPSAGYPLVLLALVTGVTALVAWPVVRHLTGRLERLRHGVETWGEGQLTHRVPVEGSDEVAAVARSFNAAAGEVEKLVTAHRSLLANASHELRSPLARLRMAIDLFGREPTEEREQEIARNLVELDELVEEIMLASRLNHVGEDDARESLDLLALAAEEAARHQVAVTGEAVTIVGNPRLVARLLRNLIQNALRHGASPVSVEVHRSDGTVELAVTDHGPGIPEGERERVFEPFYRPRGRSEHAGGWGLGLALVQQIAARHGATVRYQAPPEGGARFVVAFPAERGRDDLAAEALTSRSPEVER